MKKDVYINQVLQHVSNKAERYNIKKELLDHIEDEENRYLDAGFSKELAEVKALARMGDPEKLGKEFNKLYSNTKYKVLSYVFLILYIIGLQIVKFDMYESGFAEFAYFGEISAFISIFSTLLFISSLLCFIFSAKAKDNVALLIHGAVCLIGCLAYPLALQPFAYEIISLFTDFPAAIFSSKMFFNYEKIFSYIRDCLVGVNLPSVKQILMVLTVFSILLLVVNGIFSLVTARKFIRAENSGSDKNFLKKLSRFIKFMVALAVIASVAVCAELVNDGIVVYQNRKYIQDNSEVFLDEAKTAFENLVVPLNAQEAEKIGKEYTVDEYQMNGIGHDTYVVCENELYLVQIIDNDDDGIFETKYFESHEDNDISEKDIDKLKELPKGMSIDEFFDRLKISDIREYSVKIEKNDIYEDMMVVSDNGNNYCNIKFKNGSLIEISDFDNTY